MPTIEHRPPLLEVSQPTETLLLEHGIADGERLVDDQHIRIHMGDYREGQPHGHTRAVGLDRLINELTDIGEGQDAVHPRECDLARKAEYACI